MLRFYETFMNRILYILLILSLITGCSGLKKESPTAPGLTKPVTYEQDIRPLLEANCVRCHTGREAQGGYDLSTYIGLLGGGKDGVSNAIPGDVRSLLVRETQPGGSQFVYVGSEENAAILRTWVVRDSLALAQPTVHPVGWTDARSANFHGKALKASGWDFTVCQACHGADYGGGIARRACTACHIGSPEGCRTCHGGALSAAPPRDVSGNLESRFKGVGAHQAHVQEGPLSRAFGCSECHVAPGALKDPGHLDETPGAEVTFGVLAKTGGAVPVYDGAAVTCQNVYCHGAFKLGASAKPVWTKVGAGEAACGTCHGLPPAAPHPTITQCQLCHSEVVDASRNIIDKNKHVNGKVEVASLAACNSCHGGPDNAAPPKDVAGRTDPSFTGVGAHQSHVKEGSVAKAIACSECHVAPQSVGDRGHIDTDLPAEVTFGALARTGGASAAWDNASATCQNTYCHGTFKGGASARPVWTKVGAGEGACGTCHGLPPASPHPQVKLCSLCHNGIATDDQKVIDKGLHMNGKVDLVFPQ